MSKKGKQIIMDKNPLILTDKSEKYSEALRFVVEPFVEELSPNFTYNEILFLGMNAWNFANLGIGLSKEEFNKIVESSEMDILERKFILKMIDEKLSDYADFDRYITDFDLIDLGEDIELTVTTQFAEDYIREKMLAEDEFKDELEDQYYEGYINRNAIVLKPKQPLLDWINKLDTKDVIDKIEEANIYLIANEVEDIEKWLRKKYDYYFRIELEEWWTEKTQWPQRRSYKLFKEWFTIDFTSCVLDTVEEPIHK